MKKFLTLAGCTALGAVGVILAADSAGIAAAVSQTISLCLNTVIPSLFAFLALSSFAVSSGLVKSDKAIFLMSLVGGYPVGAKLLSERSDTKRAASMLMYCYCGSPAFLLAIGGRFGIYIWLSNALACVIFAIFANTANMFNKKGKCDKKPPNRSRISSDVFIQSVASAGAAVYRICLMMLVFAVLLRILEFAGVMRLLPESAYAFAEITNVMRLNAHPALIAMLTSLGGLCVIFQTAAIVGKRLNLRKFMLARIPIAALSGGICYTLTDLSGLAAISEASIPAIAAERPLVLITSAGTPIASVCILIMTLFLVADCNGEAFSRDSLKR
jgi:hypothetical protein